PTMNDRALQALVKLALEPEWEARFEPNSYGFRPGRSCHDAIGAIFNAIRYKPKFVLDADLSKCFDCIDHKALLLKLKTFPTIRRQIRAWLKAGVMDGNQLFPTSEGTPQGGVISPLLANVALHGMEERIKQYAESLPIKGMGKRDKKQSLSLIRYADDFVCLHEEITVVQRCQDLIEKWLRDMGLKLKPSKTQITHTLKEYEGKKPGFDFLGFKIRQFPAGKYTTGKNAQKEPLGFSTIITPSSEKQKIHYEQIAKTIKAHKSAPQEALIRHLNPVIKGWANYYCAVVSKDAYKRQDHLMYIKLRAWAKRRHPNKTVNWVINKYWHTMGGDNWVFATNQRDNFLRLHKHSSTPIVRYVKVKGEASPFDGNLVYWSTRKGTHPEVPKQVATLLKRQKGKCNCCGLYFREEDVMEIDHITPQSKGGKDEYNNLQILHRHCHDRKTTEDGSAGGTRDKCQIVEERSEVKISCCVLKTSSSREGTA
ncbi:MAG: group II intron reverse transcriptase, partial [Microcystaceae cyanobacterium]